jgi:hypothetical protein
MMAARSLSHKLDSRNLSKMPGEMAGHREAAMAWIPVVSYYLRYNTADKQPVVGIYYRDGGNSEGKMVAQHFPLPAADAFFIADLLRNEGPVFFDPASGALASGKEEIGEGEEDLGMRREV